MEEPSEICVADIYDSTGESLKKLWEEGVYQLVRYQRKIIFQIGFDGITIVMSTTQSRLFVPRSSFEVYKIRTEFQLGIETEYIEKVGFYDEGGSVRLSFLCPFVDVVTHLLGGGDVSMLFSGDGVYKSVNPKITLPPPTPPPRTRCNQDILIPVVKHIRSTVLFDVNKNNTRGFCLSPSLLFKAQSVKIVTSF